MRRSTLTLLAMPALALTLACTGVSGKDTAGPGAASASGGKHTVVYEVTGPASADITYGADGDQSQDNGAALPWRKETALSSVPFAATIVAQSKGSGAINCKITVDGQLKKENTSTGEFAVVTCSG